MKTNQVDNSQDVIDSRDVITRIEELENILGAEHETYIEAGGELDFDEWMESEPDHLSDEIQEFKTLEKLVEDASGSPDWEYGEVLIRDSYFTDYAEELCKDIGDIPKEIPWYIENAIDWEKVADAIKADYFSVDFDDVEYWIRG